jgi:large subunit ribosomal protein L30
MKKIRVRLKKSLIGRIPKQRKTSHALGLRRVGSVIEHNATPDVMGMVRSISHLVEVEEIS